MRRTWVKHLVDPVADAHDFAFVGQFTFNKGVHFVDTANLLQHLDHPFIGTSVEGPLQRSNGGGDRRVHVAQRGDGHPRTEGGGVHAMVGMQHVTDIHRVGHFDRRTDPVDHPKKIGCFTQLGVGCHQRQALSGAMEIGRQDRNLGDQSKGLPPLGVHGVVVRRGIVASQGTHAGPQGVHWRAVLGEMGNQVDDPLGQLTITGQYLLELGEFLGTGKVIVQQQVDDLFIGHVASQLVDVVPAVNQLADIAPDITQPGVRRDHPLKSLGYGGRRWRVFNDGGAHEEKDGIGTSKFSVSLRSGTRKRQPISPESVETSISSRLESSTS